MIRRLRWAFLLVVVAAGCAEAPDSGLPDGASVEPAVADGADEVVLSLSGARLGAPAELANRAKLEADLAQRWPMRRCGRTILMR